MKHARLFSALTALLLAAGVCVGSGAATRAATAGVTLDGSATGAGASATEPQLVILDTDIGDDIDDAFALALVLRSPELKILGVTTAFGDTELRARLVDRYLAAVGRQRHSGCAGVATLRPTTS